MLETPIGYAWAALVARATQATNITIHGMSGPPARAILAADEIIQATRAADTMRPSLDVCMRLHRALAVLDGEELPDPYAIDGAEDE